MANTLSPKGFTDIGLTDGNTPNFGLAPGKCLYSAVLAKGDPLILSSGYLALATVTGTTGAAVAGIATSFSWNSIAQGRTVRDTYYPGNDSVNNADVTVHYTNAANALFQVQVCASTTSAAVGGPVTQAHVGSFFNFATGSVNTYTHLSGYALDFSSLEASSTTLPFYIYNLVQAPATDPTSAGNFVIVGFNAFTKTG